MRFHGLARTRPQECTTLARLCAAELAAGRSKHPDVELTLTLGRDVLAQAEAAGDAATLRTFGARFVNDTCWCPPRITPQLATLTTFTIFACRREPFRYSR